MEETHMEGLSDFPSQVLVAKVGQESTNSALLLEYLLIIRRK